MRIASRMPALIAAVLLVPTLVAAQTYPPGNDPRDNLKPGRLDAGTAAKNMRLVSFSPKPAQFDSAKGLTFINSDIAFKDHYVYQGNFAGFTIWDVADPAKPKIVSVVECITSQGDPSIIGNLLFVSAEGGGNRNDCAKGGVQDPRDHMAGVRIYDVKDPAHPRLIKNVQTCKGSHTHTVVPDPKNTGVIYLYVSGNQGARPDSELAGCKNGTDAADTTNSLYRLDVIKVELAHPENAAVVTGARIFTGLDPAPRATSRPQRGGRGGRGGEAPAPTGPRNCHDVTAYPSMHLLAGACASYGLLVDITNPEKPVRLDAVADTNFSLWHTAVFSNDGKKVVFTDEWGGGTGPMCQKSSMMEMGGDAILTIDGQKKYTQHAYFKIPTAQSEQENCVSHNGGLLPIPGRDVMVQGWYQGGVDVIDFSDVNHPEELAFFDRGSIDPPPGADVPVGEAAGGRGGRGRGTIGGSWGAYWWNGYIYSSELDRGFDIYELQPSDKLSANEIAAAKLVKLVEYNPQSQPRYVWPPAFPVIRSYLDQLVRGNGMDAAQTSAIDKSLAAAEKLSGAARRSALTTLARQVSGQAAGAKDAARVKLMAAEITRLANATK
ncbi:MAG TPA: hypothetical protein VG916_04130 [Gemmatimonadaceae bacterium]|nr:hypothetical protein [Gemmatimonadaceae bacterium]